MDDKDCISWIYDTHQSRVYSAIWKQSPRAEEVPITRLTIRGGGGDQGIVSSEEVWTIPVL